MLLRPTQFKPGYVRGRAQRNIVEVEKLSYGNIRYDSNIPVILQRGWEGGGIY